MNCYNFTRDADIFRQVLEHCDASIESYVMLLRLQSTCRIAKRTVDAFLLPGQKDVPRWLAVLHARTNTITEDEVLAHVNGGPGTKEHPRIGRRYKYIKRAEVFRVLQDNYFFDERLVGMIFHHMRTEVHQMIEAIDTSITHDFYEGTLLLADVCIKAMWHHVKNRNIVLHGCRILADIQNKASNQCAFIGKQLPVLNGGRILANVQNKASNPCTLICRQLAVLTNALHYHRSDVAVVSIVLRFVDHINQECIFFGRPSLGDCSVQTCDEFSAALADVMQYHVHATEWMDVQVGVQCHTQNRPSVVVACGILARLWRNTHNQYYASAGFAKSVDALANTVRLNKGQTILRCAAHAASGCLFGRSVACSETHKNVAHMLQVSGLTPTVCSTKDAVKTPQNAPQIAHHEDRPEMNKTEVATMGDSTAIKSCTYTHALYCSF